MAAVGTLRVLTLKHGGDVRMRWRKNGGGPWRPELCGVDGGDDAVSETVHGSLSVPLDRFKLLGNNITVEPKEFVSFVNVSEDGLARDDRRGADFAVAFGSEICTQPRDDKRIQYTDLCFMTGSGHQHFLGTMEALLKCVEVRHIKDALFGDWRREKGNSMRWDPQDAAEYALRWGDPSLDGASAVWGANLLAVEGLPLFGAFADGRGWLKTTGFWTRPAYAGGRRGETNWPEFSWPIWTGWAGVDVVRSMVGLDEVATVGRREGRWAGLSEDEIEKRVHEVREVLRETGIGEVFRAARVRIGKGANFKVSFRPAVAV